MDIYEDLELHEDLDINDFLQLAEEVANCAVFSKLLNSTPVESDGRELIAALDRAKAEAIDRLIEYVMPIFQQATLGELKSCFARITVDSKLVESMHSYLATLSTEKETTNGT